MTLASERVNTTSLMAATGSIARAGALSRPDGTPIRVLVVDDEPSLAEGLASVLRHEGCDVRNAGTWVSGVRTGREFGPDAVVLDMMLPDFDGLEVMRRLRENNPLVGMLFLTARDSVEDWIAGIIAGGDDYVTEPFSLEEVLARLRGMLRRAGMSHSNAETHLSFADLTMDEEAREVSSTSATCAKGSTRGVTHSSKPCAASGTS